MTESTTVISSSETNDIILSSSNSSTNQSQQITTQQPKLTTSSYPFTPFNPFPTIDWSKIFGPLPTISPIVLPTLPTIDFSSILKNLPTLPPFQINPNILSGVSIPPFNLPTIQPFNLSNIFNNGFTLPPILFPTLPPFNFPTFPPFQLPTLPPFNFPSLPTINPIDPFGSLFPTVAPPSSQCIPKLSFAIQVVPVFQSVVTQQIKNGDVYAAIKAIQDQALTICNTDQVNKLNAMIIQQADTIQLAEKALNSTSSSERDEIANYVESGNMNGINSFITQKVLTTFFTQPDISSTFSQLSMKITQLQLFLLFNPPI